MAAAAPLRHRAHCLLDLEPKHTAVDTLEHAVKSCERHLTRKMREEEEAAKRKREEDAKRKRKESVLDKLRKQARCSSGYLFYVFLFGMEIETCERHL